MSQCWALRTLLSELLRARAQDVWEDAFKHAIEDHMNCKGAQGWERRWLVVYKSEIVRRHDTTAIWVAFARLPAMAGIWVAFFREWRGNMTVADRRSSSRPAARAWVVSS